jgi:hypothetical protein
LTAAGLYHRFAVGRARDEIRQHVVEFVVPPAPQISSAPFVEKKISMTVKETVREKYGQAALRVATGGSSCCNEATALDACCDPITSNLYEPARRANCGRCR